MAINDIPLFTPMNCEEVKPPFCKPERPFTSMESHFEIIQRVNACINEVNQFEQRMNLEMSRFMNESSEGNTAFKEAIQTAHNAFITTVQQEINNFEANLSNNYELFRKDVDLRISNFENSINNEFLNYRAQVNTIVNTFKTHVDEEMVLMNQKIENYKDYMVDNLDASVTRVFDQKAQSGEISELMKSVYGSSRTFKGVATYDEIQANSSANNGDYYFCSTDNHYYQRASGVWIDIGFGSKVEDDFEAFAINTEKEHIDARTDETGYEYETIGDSIRGQNAVNGQTIKSVVFKQSVNLYNAALQTKETVSEYYYQGGAPYTANQTVTDQYDSLAPIKVKQNTKYTMGLVPPVANCSVPWGSAVTGITFFDKNNNFISETNQGTFITPAGCDYMIVNLWAKTVPLDNCNTHCMLVEGDSLPSEYIPYKCVPIDQNVAENKEEIDFLKAILGVGSKNIYNPAEQTPETISDYYYQSGVPYMDSESITINYDSTAKIKVKPSTTYTVGLVPSVGETSVPWGKAYDGVNFFSASDEYLGKSAESVFTTPPNVDYIIMNFWPQGGVNLNTLNKRCMIVEGEKLPNNYYGYGIPVDALSGIDGNGIYYHFSNDVLTVNSHFGSGKEIQYTLMKKGGNNLFDFAEIGLNDGSGKTVSKTTDCETVLANIGSDWHAPYIIKAVNNGDGDQPNNQYFTGGAHCYNNSESGASATARTVNVNVYADGALVNGDGYCSAIRVEWENRIQAYNTTKEDGSGREVLVEKHSMEFNGVTWKCHSDIIPLEDVVIVRFYGLQCSRFHTHSNLRFIGGSDRTEHALDVSSDCGEGNAHEFNCYGGGTKLVMGIDPNYDIGDRSLLGSGEKPLFYVDYGKAYFYLISDKELKGNTMYSYEGYYSVKPE